MSAEFDALSARRRDEGSADLPETAEDWPVGVARCAADGTILALNAAAADILRRFGPEPISTDIFAQLRRAAPDLRAALALPNTRGRVVRALRVGAEGASLSAMLRDGALTVILADETAQVRAEREAERQRARFDALADAPRSGATFLVSAHGVVIGWSGSARRFEGMTEREALGLSLSALLARTSFPLNARTLIEAATRAGEATVCGVRLTPGRAPVRLSLSLHAVRGRDGGVESFVAQLREEVSAPDGAAELRRLADTDPLTRVLNRRAFEEAARATLDSAAARGETCGLILVDLDRFKAINDANGHCAGDVALKALSEALKDSSRGGDVVGRLGGDEFAILLPQADIDRATQVASRLCAAVRMLRPMLDGTLLRLTASIGVAESRSGEGLDQLLLRADVALYSAKAAGRNRVARA